MRHPLVLRIRLGFDGVEAAVAQRSKAVHYPVHMLLDGENHRGQHRRAARARDGEKVGKASRHQAEVGLGSRLPCMAQRLAAATRDVDLQQSAGHGVVTGREHDAVEFIERAAGLQTAGRDALDTLFAQVYQSDVVAVVSVVVAGVDADPLRSDRMVAGAQQRRNRRVTDDAANLRAHEVGGCVIGPFIHHQVIEGVHEIDTATLPAPLVLAQTIRGADLMPFACAFLVDGAGRALLASLAPEFRVIVFPPTLVVVVHRHVARRNAEVGRALEYVQPIGLPRDHWNALNAG